MNIIEQKKIKHAFSFLFLVVFCMLLALPRISAAAPLISSVSGTTSFNNGDVVTVSGSGFGTIRTADYWDTFDDYSADWSVNAIGQSAFPSTGSKWAGDGGWTKTFFNEIYQTNINGKPLLHLDSSGAQYSTGRGFTQTIEYYNAGTDGAQPNSGIGMTTSTTSNELYIVYYRRYDPLWNYLLGSATDSIIEKEMEIWLSDNSKMSVNSRYNDPFTGVYFPQSLRSRIIFGIGDSSTLDAPNSNGAIPVNDGGKWYEVKIYLKLNTPGAQDGIVKVWINGQQSINDNTVNLRGSSSAQFGGDTLSRGIVYFFGNIQWGGTAQFTPIGAGNEWDRSVDDVWLWQSNQSALDSQFPLIPVVYLSNQSTWGTGPADKLNGDSNFVRQKVGGTASADLGFKSWADNQFKFEVNKTGLNASQPIYLYAINWSGSVNQNGYQLGSLPADTTPPSAPSGLAVQ